MNTNQLIDYILDRFNKTSPSTDEVIEYREYLCDMTDSELQNEIDLFQWVTLGVDKLTPIQLDNTILI